jgi:hypothetical protein
MSVDLKAMRDEMLPGLVKAFERYSFSYNDPRGLYASFAETKEIVATNIFNGSKTASGVPSIPVALAMGAAVAVINNPKTTRRGLVSWVSDRFSNLEIEE